MYNPMKRTFEKGPAKLVNLFYKFVANVDVDNEYPPETIVHEGRAYYFYVQTVAVGQPEPLLYRSSE